MRTVTRSATIASTRCTKASRVKYANHNTTNFATLNNGLKESSIRVLPSSPIAVAKSLNQQKKSSTPPSTASSWPVGVHARALDENRKLDKFSETLVHDEKQGKIARVWEPVEKELWLERFGGPWETMERVTGGGTVVLRDVGEDGKAYLRVLI
ncbi:hypothetical protein E8E12_009823 [Didymella heteroderae]|uniref:Uncharacterized protein n=1 Tax=Didymella heteroderae TaxID=1769908 RepID=A0A9P5C692_9PLEO|nr:hypothetical protein E8E12_009823 [Didymella heteroderae]